MASVKLYRKSSFGISTWRIWDEVNKIFYASAMVEGGAERVSTDTVELNQSGRTMEEQVRLEMKSRISRMLDKGYKPTRQEAINSGSTNQLGLINPMLAKPIEDVKNISFAKAYLQPKLDGHRCLITKQGGDTLAYTRKGKLIETIDPILSDIDRWLPEGYTLDGELYVHGKKLQEISSLIKRAQPDNSLLNYHFYDLVAGQPFAERFEEMQGLIKHAEDPRIKLVSTVKVGSMEEVKQCFEIHRSLGLEGSMLRLSSQGYEDAKRSAQLLKVKAWQDMEVTVIDVKPSKDGWGICVAKLDNGKVFDISAPGSITEKTRVLINKQQYIGRRLTIEFANLTNDGLPFHAAALRWREDV